MQPANISASTMPMVVDSVVHSLPGSFRTVFSAVGEVLAGVEPSLPGF
jgi:hypothetical protein